MSFVENGLSTSGTKKQVIKRIIDWKNEGNSDDDDDDSETELPMNDMIDDDSDDDDDEECTSEWRKDVEGVERSG